MVFSVLDQFWQTFLMYFWSWEVKLMFYSYSFSLHVVPANLQPFEPFKYCFLPQNVFKKCKKGFFIKILPLFCLETPIFWFSNANMGHRNVSKNSDICYQFPQNFHEFFPGENIGLYKALWLRGFAKFVRPSFFSHVYYSILHAFGCALLLSVKGLVSQMSRKNACWKI